jgi:hypothetical protein
MRLTKEAREGYLGNCFNKIQDSKRSTHLLMALRGKKGALSQFELPVLSPPIKAKTRKFSEATIVLDGAMNIQRLDGGEVPVVSSRVFDLLSGVLRSRSTSWLMPCMEKLPAGLIQS